MLSFCQPLWTDLLWNNSNDNNTLVLYLPFIHIFALLNGFALSRVNVEVSLNTHKLHMLLVFVPAGFATWEARTLNLTLLCNLLEHASSLHKAGANFYHSWKLRQSMARIQCHEWCIRKFRNRLNYRKVERQEIERVTWIIIILQHPIGVVLCSH